MGNVFQHLVALAANSFWSQIAFAVVLFKWLLKEERPLKANKDIQTILALGRQDMVHAQLLYVGKHSSILTTYLNVTRGNGIL